MISILRQNQRVLMLVVAVLTIFAFIWLYNPAELNKLGANHIATIYDEGITQADIDRQVRTYSLAMKLGQYQLLSDLGGAASNEDQALEEFVWNIQVLQHQARELGVEPTADQVAAVIKTLPVFQTNGQFDYQKYSLFVENQLGPRGFTDAQLENVIRDSLRLERIKTVVSAPVAVTPAEIDETLRVFQKADLQIARFTPVDAAGLTVLDEEIQKFYDENKAALLSPETRSVKFVEFVLPADKASATGKDKVDALNKVAEDASAFAEKAATSFESIAQSLGLPVKTSPQFNRSGQTLATPQAPAAENQDLPGLAPTAFLLTKENPVSDVVQSGDKFFVIQLDQVTAERPLTMAEVRPMIEPSILAGKRAKLAEEKAAQIVAKVRDAVSAGRPFAEVAAAEGLKVETFSGFEPATQARDQSSKVPLEVVRLSLMLEPAQMSGFIPNADGGLILFVAARAPLSLSADEQAKQKQALAQEILESKRRILFMSWLNGARDDAKISMVQHNR